MAAPSLPTCRPVTMSCCVRSWGTIESAKTSSRGCRCSSSAALDHIESILQESQAATRCHVRPQTQTLGHCRMGLHRLVEQRVPDLVVGMVSMLMNADGAREVYAAARIELRSAVS
jgi:hypothetical protein